MKPEVGKVRAEDIAAFLAKFDDVEEAIDAIRNFAQPAVSAGLVDLPPAAKPDPAAKDAGSDQRCARGAFLCDNGAYFA